MSHFIAKSWRCLCLSSQLLILTEGFSKEIIQHVTCDYYFHRILHYFHLESFFCCYLPPLTHPLHKFPPGWKLWPKKRRLQTKPIRDWHQVGGKTAVSLKLRGFQNPWIDESIWVLCFAEVLLTLDPTSNLRMFLSLNVVESFPNKIKKTIELKHNTTETKVPRLLCV